MVAKGTEEQRLTANITLAVGAIELVMAMVGLYGMLLFALYARTREIGIRLALGSGPLLASWTVISSGLRYALIGGAVGLVLGVPVALISARTMLGARATDPVPFMIALVSVAGACALAASIPLRRASRVQPATALRHD
jgi:ABC-type antimicrobial peptide transport system permease subunit